jgi:putative methyltransferase (TIGR04325 family)
MEWKDTLKSFTPPIALNVLRPLKDRLSPPYHWLTYVSTGWNTKLPANANPRNLLARLTQDDVLEWGPVIDTLKQDPPRLTAAIVETALGKEQWSSEQSRFLAFAYVFARTAHGIEAPRVLDYGGNIGYYYLLARAFMPSVAAVYHCKELPGVVDTARGVIPNIIWHTDDSCFDEQFDLIMFSSVLQYIENWQEVLRHAAAATRRLLYISLTPAVEKVPSYVALHEGGGLTWLHNCFNRDELEGVVSATGLRMVQRFSFGTHTRIRGAPEQPSYFGWLFEKVP